MEMKVPPQSKDAEMMVIGAMLNSINALNTACDLLEETDFYFAEHKIIFSHMRYLRSTEKPVDVVILAEALKSSDSLEKAGGMAYIAMLSNFATSSAYIEDHAEIVISKSILRKIIFSAQSIEQKAITEKQEAYDILEDARKAFFEIGQRTSKAKYKSLPKWIEGPDGIEQKPFMQWVTERQAHFLEHGHKGDVIAGMPTHFIDLDKKLNGLGNGHLFILAARPGMGKTALALNICANIAFKNDVPVGIFSLEMPTDELILRMIASHSLVDFNRIKIGDISGIEYQNLLAATHDMKRHNVFIDDQAGIKISDLKARARRMKENHNIGFMMVDYMQLISGTGSKVSQENRQVQVAEISKEMKNIAKELNIPVLCLSQLSRGPENRDNKMPQLSDLRESGAIEQDADVVMMINRPEYYDPNDKPGFAEIKIAKNRHGETGKIDLVFDGAHFLFKNAAKIQFPDDEMIRQKAVADEEFKNFE